MSWYTTGTITATNGSDVIDGNGTSFLNVVKAGHIYYGPDKELYEIASVTSDDRIVLTTTYNGATVVGSTSWAIIPTQGMVASLVSQVQDLLTGYADAKAQLESGAFTSGTVSSPGITYAGDPTTGAYLVSTGIMALVASGVANINITSTGIQLNYSGAVKAETTSSGLTVYGDVSTTAHASVNTTLTSLDARITALETP